MFNKESFFEYSDAHQDLIRCSGNLFIYVVEFDDGLVKVGKTSDFKRRFSNLQHGRSIIKCHVFLTGNGDKVEQGILKELSDFKVKGEYFKVCITKAVEVAVDNLKPVEVLSLNCKDRFTSDERNAAEIVINKVNRHFSNKEDNGGFNMHVIEDTNKYLKEWAAIMDKNYYANYGLSLDEVVYCGLHLEKEVDPDWQWCVGDVERISYLNAKINKLKTLV